MALVARPSNQYEKDIKLMKRRGKDISKIDHVIDLLCAEETLPEQYRDHPLRGNWIGFRECHIEPDWLLIYFINGKDLELILSRTGSHSDFRF